MSILWLLLVSLPLQCFARRLCPVGSFVGNVSAQVCDQIYYFCCSLAPTTFLQVESNQTLVVQLPIEWSNESWSFTHNQNPNVLKVSFVLVCFLSDCKWKELKPFFSLSTSKVSSAVQICSVHPFVRPTVAAWYVASRWFWRLMSLENPAVLMHLDLATGEFESSEWFHRNFLVVWFY